MADLRTVLVGLTLVVAYTSAASYFVYPGIYPIVYFEDFRYLPMDHGYTLWYRTDRGVTHQEHGIVPEVPFPDGDDGSNPDTLGSSREGRLKSKLPLKNRKVSPKLLASLSG